MGYYLKIKFKEKIDGRKIWYFNNCYLCDCINATFENKEDCKRWINVIKNKPQYKNSIESITLHGRR